MLLERIWTRYDESCTRITGISHHRLAIPSHALALFNGIPLSDVENSQLQSPICRWCSRIRKMAGLTGSEHLERLDGHASVAERAEFFGCKRRRFAEAAPGVEEAGH